MVTQVAEDTLIIMDFFHKFVLVRVLQNPLQLVKNLLASLIFYFVILGGSLSIANAELAQVTLSIDATLVPTFSDLIKQAESLAATEISQRFQADPTLTEVQIMVLGERNGQLVSLLSSSISRNAWQENPDLRQWTQYFSESNILLGYRLPDPVIPSTSVSTQATARNNRPSSARTTPTRTAPTRTTSVEPTSTEPDPFVTLEEDRSTGRISEEDYWQRLDTLD